jgi:hypothetical protein
MFYPYIIIKLNNLCVNYIKLKYFLYYLINKEMDDLISLSNICKKNDEEPDNWWFCSKCHRKIMDGEYHKKYCNSKKDKHKHKLTKDYTKQFVKDGCCFRCGRKDHYILDCKYPKKI